MKADSIHAVNDMSLTRDSARPRRRGPEHSYRLYLMQVLHRNKRKQYGAIILTAAFGILRDIINQQTTLLVNVPLAKFDKIFRDITKVLPNKQQLFFQRSFNIYIDDFF